MSFNHPAPYVTRDNRGDEYTVHKILDDGLILTTTKAATGYVSSQIFNADGTSRGFANSQRLLPPVPKGLAEYHELHPQVQILVLNAARAAATTAVVVLLGLTYAEAHKLLDYIERA